MIGVYGQTEENGWFDCEGASGWMPWSVGYCQVTKPLAQKVYQTSSDAYTAAQKPLKTVRTIAIILLVLGLGVGTFVGINALRKKRTRKNPKQSAGNRIARVLGGLVLTVLGAVGYVGPQVAEPVSTVVGGGMTIGGLYLVGSGVLGSAEASKIRKEIRG